MFIFGFSFLIFLSAISFKNVIARLVSIIEKLEDASSKGRPAAVVVCESLGVLGAYWRERLKGSITIQ